MSQYSKYVTNGEPIPSYHQPQSGPFGKSLNQVINKTADLNTPFDQLQYEEAKLDGCMKKPCDDYPSWPPKKETGFIYPSQSKSTQYELLGDEKGPHIESVPYIESMINSNPPEFSKSNDSRLTPQSILNPIQNQYVEPALPGMCINPQPFDATYQSQNLSGRYHNPIDPSFTKKKPVGGLNHFDQSNDAGPTTLEYMTDMTDMDNIEKKIEKEIKKENDLEPKHIVDTNHTLHGANNMKYNFVHKHYDTNKWKYYGSEYYTFDFNDEHTIRRIELGLSPFTEQFVPYSDQIPDGDKSRVTKMKFDFLVDHLGEDKIEKYNLHADNFELIDFNNDQTIRKIQLGLNPKSKITIIVPPKNSKLDYDEGKDRPMYDLKCLPVRMNNTIDGIFYDFSHWNYLPKNKNRFCWVLTRDKRWFFLLMWILVGIILYFFLRTVTGIFLQSTSVSDYNNGLSLVILITLVILILILKLKSRRIRRYLSLVGVILIILIYLFFALPKSNNETYGRGGIPVPVIRQSL